MKTLELELKKKVLIVDESDFDYYELSENGIYFKVEKGDRYYLGWKFEFLCKGSYLTEEIASELVENKTKHKFENKVLTFYNYKNLELFISAVESKGFHWLDNPISDPNKIIQTSLSFKKFAKHSELFDRAEEKTFRNPLIFVKNS